MRYGTPEQQQSFWQHYATIAHIPVTDADFKASTGTPKTKGLGAQLRAWVRDNVERQDGNYVAHVEGYHMNGSGIPKTESDSDDGNARGPRYVDAEFLAQWPPHVGDDAACKKQMREAHELYTRRAISRGTLSKILYLNEAYMLGHGPKSMYFLRGKNDGFPALSTTYLTRPPAGGEESKVGMVKAHLQGKKMPADMAKLYLGLEVEGRGTKRARE